MPAPAFLSALVLVSIVILPVRTFAQRSNWPSYNGNHESTRFSTLAEITPANAAGLVEVCRFDTGEHMRSSPALS